MLCSLPSLEPYDAPSPSGSSTLLSIVEYKGMIERDRALLHPCVLLWPVLLVDYESHRHPRDNGVYEVARFSAVSTNSSMLVLSAVMITVPQICPYGVEAGTLNSWFERNSPAR